MKANICVTCGAEIAEEKKFCSLKCSTKKVMNMHTRETVIRLYREGKSPADIHREVGISRQRVSQVMKILKLETDRVPKVWLITCKQCGKEFESDKQSQAYCSRECFKIYSASSKVKLHCTWCGKEIARKISRAKKVTIPFCTRTCHGKWLAETSGFHAFPEHIHRRVKTRVCPECGAPAKLVAYRQYNRASLVCDNGHRMWIEINKASIAQQG